MCQGACKHGGFHKSLKSYGLLALRLVMGAVFLYTGYMKVGPNHTGAAMMMEKMVGLPGGDFWAYFVGILELLGAAMLILGVFVRYAAVVLGIIMIVAIFTVHRGAPFMGNGGYALPLVLLGNCFALMGTGAGKMRAWKLECHCKECKMGGGCCGGMQGAEGKACNCGGGGQCGCKKDEITK